MQNSVLLQNVTTEQLGDLFDERLERKLQAFKKDLNTQQANEELLTREETCNFLKINSSTLWAYTNKGKVKAYGIGNRRYYKRSELLESLTQLKK